MSSDQPEQQQGAGPSGEASSSARPGVFDVDTIRRLVELMHQHDLNEVDLRQGNARIQLRRGGPVPAPVVHTVAQPAPMPAVPGPTAERPAVPAVAAVDESKYVLVKSPMVGTFYAAPNPDAAAYVKVGDHVGPETTVCIIEAMKLFNEIPAECSGKVVAALVQNGDPVEFGQALFKVDPNG